jgi:capsular polysaccharide transport system ATP-binding protein
MIILNRVTKKKKVNGRTRDVLSLVDIEIPSDRRIALFAPAAEDGTLVINLLAGLETATAGLIRRAASVSFPVGHIGGLQGELTLRHNSAHVARLYGADASSVVDFMSNIAGLRDALDVRFRDLPTALKRQFAQVLAYSIPFDTYLLNAEPTRLPADHRAIACALFEARTRTSGAIVAVHQAAFAKKYCDMALCLRDGTLVLFGDVEEALAASRARGSQPRDHAPIHGLLES